MKFQRLAVETAHMDFAQLSSVLSKNSSRNTADIRSILKSSSLVTMVVVAIMVFQMLDALEMQKAWSMPISVGAGIGSYRWASWMVSA